MEYFDQILEGLKYALPAAVTGYVTYYFLNRFFIHEEKKQILLAKRELKRYSIPVRMQAYERLAVFLERISPLQLIKNVPVKNLSKDEYLNALIFQIEGEFEHNLSQQIYISSKAWKMIKTGKNAIIFFIRNIAEDDEIKSAKELQKTILLKSADNELPTDFALEYIRNEVAEIL